KEATDSKYDAEKLDERIAKLIGGVAVIRVGAATETEMKYLKLKVEDAVNATKAAIEEGVVAGGGTAFIKAGEKVREWMKAGKIKGKEFGTKEFEAGFSIVLKAIEAPLRQIAINAGKDDGVIVESIRNKRGNGGYDALKDEMVSDMLAAGIIDPVKVTRSGLQNAASAAAILLTTEVAIADEPKEEKGGGGGMPGGMGGMGGMDY
ncbi:MAG: TCP-1/cpn60 chaperonin family protein, partial [Patescibacteria group bacterium]